MTDPIRVRIEDWEPSLSLDAWTLRYDDMLKKDLEFDMSEERVNWDDPSPELNRIHDRRSAYKLELEKMNINEIYTSNWLRAADLQGREVKVRIEDWDVTEFKQTDGSTKKQVALKFFGKEKRLGLNKINSSMIAGMYGEDTEGWIGKEVTIYPTKDRGPNGLVDCIRVRFVDPRSANGNGEAAKPKLKKMVDELNPPDDMNDEVPF